MLINFRLARFILSQNLKLHPYVFSACKKIHAANGLHLKGDSEIFVINNFNFVNNSNVLKLKEDEYKFIVNRFGFINKNYLPKYYDKYIEDIVSKMNLNLKLTNFLKDESNEYFDMSSGYISLFYFGPDESTNCEFDITKFSLPNSKFHICNYNTASSESEVGEYILNNIDIINLEYYSLFINKLKSDDINISYDYYDYFTGDVHCDIDYITDKKLIKCINHGIMVNSSFAKRLLDSGNEQFKDKCITSIFSRATISSVEFFDSTTFLGYFPINFYNYSPILRYSKIIKNFKYNYMYSMVLRNLEVPEDILDIPEYTLYVAACKVGNLFYINYIEEMYYRIGHFVKILDMENEQYVHEIIYDKPKIDLDFSIINPYNMDFEFSVDENEFEVLELDPNYLTNMDSLAFTDLF